MEFDPGRALEAAMRVFWSKGYEATSLEDLLQAMGLSRSSLYQTFGSKQQLFDRCVDHYCAMLAAQMLTQLGEAPSGRRFIEDTFLAIASDAAGPLAAKGCLLTNTASEFGRRNSKVARRVAEGIDRFVKVFLAAVRRAQQEGGIAAGRDAYALANYLVSSMSGLKTVVKARADKRRAKEIVRVILTALD